MSDNNQNIEEPLEVLKVRKLHLEKRLYNFRFKFLYLLTFLIVGGLLGYASFGLMHPMPNPNFNNYAPFIIIGSFFSVFIYFYFTLALTASLQNVLRRVDFKLAQIGSEELKENIEENFFTKLVQINFKYLDQYYLQTQEQAEKSFRLAGFASISGLIIVLIGIIMMFSSKVEPAYVTTAAGILSEFIAAIFFYLYNKTILKMSHYHQKLVITQNISLALKITDDLSDENKNESLKMIIDRLTSDVNNHLTDHK